MLPPPHPAPGVIGARILVRPLLPSLMPEECLLGCPHCTAITLVALIAQMCPKTSHANRAGQRRAQKYPHGDWCCGAAAPRLRGPRAPRRSGAAGPPRHGAAALRCRSGATFSFCLLPSARQHCGAAAPRRHVRRLASHYPVASSRNGLTGYQKHTLNIHPYRFRLKILQN